MVPDLILRRRKAALLLHGLAPGDREAVMSYLPEEETQQLSELLAELHSLGLAPSRTEDLLAEVVGGNTDPSTKVLRSVVALTAAEATAVFSGQSEATMRLVLSLSPGQWARDFRPSRPNIPPQVIASEVQAEIHPSRCTETGLFACAVMKQFEESAHATKQLIHQNPISDANRLMRWLAALSFKRKML